MQQKTKTLHLLAPREHPSHLLQHAPAELSAKKIFMNSETALKSKKQFAVPELQIGSYWSQQGLQLSFDSKRIKTINI
jgi:hypothetical protein